MPVDIGYGYEIRTARDMDELVSMADHEATANQRLRKARIAAGFKTAREAYEKFGWNANSYRAHEAGPREYGRKKAVLYGRAFNVSPMWLLTGEEDIGRGTLALNIDDLWLELHEIAQATIPTLDGTGMLMLRKSHLWQALERIGVDVSGDA